MPVPLTVVMTLADVMVPEPSVMAVTPPDSITELMTAALDAVSSATGRMASGPTPPAVSTTLAV